MENATKAILLAAGVIITLATVSIIITVFMQNQAVIKEGTKNIDLSTITYHNSQFTTYEKEGLSYSNILTLVGKIVDNNLRQTDENFMVSVEAKEYESKTGGTYKATNSFVTFEAPIDNSFMQNSVCQELNSDSVYRGKSFRVTLKYNDMGIVSVVRIEKENR